MIEARAWGLGVLRGASQIYFQTSVIAAVAVFGAFFIGNWWMGVLALVGVLGGVIGGRLSAYSLETLELGLQGFCGALVGAAVFAAGIFPGQLPAIGIALVGGLVTGPVTRLVDTLFATPLLKGFGLPATTVPFVLVATATVMLAPASPLASPSGADIPAGDTAVVLLRSVLTNISQVILVNSVWAGALILAGLFVAGWRIGLAALAGSVVGTLSALVLGQPLHLIGDGMVGYSSVLTALALAVTFLRPGFKAWLYAVPWVVVTAGVTVLMQHTVSYVYTWPYILTTWVALISVHLLARSQGVIGRWTAMLVPSC